MLGTYHRLGVHIYASDIEVVRQARKKIRKSMRRGRDWRQARHWFFRQMLAYHHDARKLAREFAL